MLRKKHAACDALISGISHWAPLSLAAIFFCYIKLFRTGRRSRPPPSPPRGRGHNAADRPNRRVEKVPMRQTAGHLLTASILRERDGRDRVLPIAVLLDTGDARAAL